MWKLREERSGNIRIYDDDAQLDNADDAEFELSGNFLNTEHKREYAHKIVRRLNGYRPSIRDMIEQLLSKLTCRHEWLMYDSERIGRTEYNKVFGHCAKCGIVKAWSVTRK